MDEQPQAHSARQLRDLVALEDTGCLICPDSNAERPSISRGGLPEGSDFPDTDKKSILLVELIFYWNTGKYSTDTTIRSCSTKGCVNTDHHTFSSKQRFFDKVEIDDNTKCWNFTGCSTGTDKGWGHGRISHKGKLMIATHYLLKILKGITIPKGQVVMHSCDNTKCVNPDHLSLGSQSQNMKDAYARGRATRPTSFNSAVLTREDVIAIRKLHAEHKVAASATAKQYNVGSKTIRRVLKRETWKDVE